MLTILLSGNAAYVALLVPYSVTRLLALSGMEVPFEVMIFAFTCWFMLGVSYLSISLLPF